MVFEVADIRVRPGEQTAFDAAIARGVKTVIAHAKGFLGWRVLKGVESAERYLLVIEWETLENHTVDFRGSEAFAEWRAIVGPFFAGAPVVEHFDLLAGSATS